MIIPVILSGGAGTRLWPSSRQSYPKPFLDFDGTGSLLQKTCRRVRQIKDSVQPIIVTGQDYYFQSREQLKEIKETADFILEPVGRNTAPAILIAALYAAEKYGEDAILLVVAADHLIKNQEAFNDAVSLAAMLAKQQKLVTFGIVPEFPHTGFGYIKAGQEVIDKKDSYHVASFHEKPEKQRAIAMLAEGGYFWNSGIFCFSARVIINEFQSKAEELFVAVNNCWEISKNNGNKDGFFEIDGDSFSECSDISIDYAVMEKSKNVAVVKAGFDWNDIGSWDAVADMVTPDTSQKNLISIDSETCYFQTEKRLVAAIGLDNLVVIDTPDALLIAKKDRAQDVKKVVDQLKKEGNLLFSQHNTMYRPWGSYTVLEENKGYKIKRIEVKQGQSLSLQMHHHRSEHWIVVSGMAKVINGDQEFFLRQNESTYIPAGHKHRLSNPGMLDLVIIEVQSGDYLEEDDIVRFSDNYGRE